jgi:hypothetical protein
MGNYLKNSDKISKKDLICPICYDLYLKPRSTYCGHSLCDQCYFENMLKFNICPICRSNIKKSKGCFSKSFENIIENFINESSAEMKKNFIDRKSEYQEWKESKKVSLFEIDQKYDIKDTENIWCVGIVKDIIKNENHSDTLFVHYLGWDEIYDEYICANSDRIAPLGMFTKRRDIPRYSIHNPNGNMMMSFIIWEREYHRDFLLINQRLRNDIINSDRRNN